MSANSQRLLFRILTTCLRRLASTIRAKAIRTTRIARSSGVPFRSGSTTVPSGLTNQLDTLLVLTMNNQQNGIQRTLDVASLRTFDIGQSPTFESDVLIVSDWLIGADPQRGSMSFTGNIAVRTRNGSDS